MLLCVVPENLQSEMGGKVGVIAWIVAGLIAGSLVSMVLKGRDSTLLRDTLLGIAGGLVGGLLSSVLLAVPSPFSIINTTTMMIGFVGALVVIGGARVLAADQGVL